MPGIRTRQTSARPRAARTTLVAALAAVTLAACGGGEDEEVADAPVVTDETETEVETGPETETETETADGAQTGTDDGAAADELTGEQAQVAENWELFFAGDTPAGERVSLLEDGEQFAPLIEAQAQSAMAQQTSAEVTAVTVEGERAQVTYDILLGGNPALTGQTGEAVLVDGVWKVGQESFCALLSLSGGAQECSPAASPS